MDTAAVLAQLRRWRTEVDALIDAMEQSDQGTQLLQRKMHADSVTESSGFDDISATVSLVRESVKKRERQ